MRCSSYLKMAILFLDNPKTVQLSADGMVNAKSHDNDWLRGVSADRDAECSVEGECIVGSGLGNCTVLVDPAKAVPLGSTDAGNQSEILFNSIKMSQHGTSWYTKPETDITIVGHSSMSHWNICWKDNAQEVGRIALRGANVEDYCFYVNGLCFLWASPCSGGCSQLYNHSAYSWFCPGLRYATEAEWSAALPTLYGQRRAFFEKCAAPPLDPMWNHCDYGNMWVRIEDNSWNELVLVCDTTPDGTNSPTPSPPPNSPTLFPTPRPTPSPSRPPTPSPTPSPTSWTGVSGGAVAAIGDPHLQNVFGERFDLMRPGKHVLINIPRGERAENVFLRVDAEARRLLGGNCADMYFQEINITGEWVEPKLTSGLHFQAQGVHIDKPNWIKFHKVFVKVAHGRTQQGAHYLNFYVKHLGHAGFLVGGLLGEDDHKLASTPTDVCVHHVSLLQTAVLNVNGRPHLRTAGAMDASRDDSSRRVSHTWDP